MKIMLHYLGIDKITDMHLLKGLSTFSIFRQSYSRKLITITFHEICVIFLRFDERKCSRVSFSRIYKNVAFDFESI